MDSPEEPAIHPLLRSRWSPQRWDGAHRLARDDVDVLLEAARWAPSAGNSQPWRFVVGLRGDAVHQRLCAHLTPGSSRWAPEASALVANCAHRLVADTDWEYSEFATYDLGQAVAHLTIQAQAMGLATRQFRAFERSALEAEFELPTHWEVTTMTAIGRPLHASDTPRRRVGLRQLAVTERAGGMGGSAVFED